MTRCPYADETLALYVEGDLSATILKPVGAHVAGCPRCSEVCRSLLESLTLFRSLRSEPLDPAVLSEARQNVFELLSAGEDVLGWAVRTERVLLNGFRRQRYALAGMALLAVAGLAAYGILGPGPVAPADPVARIEQPASESEIAFAVTEAFPPVEIADPEVVEPTMTEDGEATLPLALEPAASESPGSERAQVLVKLVTDNPDVIIYWVLDTRGGGV